MKTSEYNESVELYSDRLYLFACKRLSDSELAKDLVQKSYTRVWLKREEIDASKIKSYLFTTCHHLIVDWVRKNQRMVKESGPEESYSPQQSDLKEIIDQALDKLNDVQRSILMLRDYEGYSYEEIGKITELSESQVKVYLFRARKKMKAYLVKLDLVL